MSRPAASLCGEDEDDDDTGEVVTLLMKEPPFFLSRHLPSFASPTDWLCGREEHADGMPPGMGGIPALPYMAAEVNAVSRLASASLKEGRLPPPTNPCSSPSLTLRLFLACLHACVRACKHS